MRLDSLAQTALYYRQRRRRGWVHPTPVERGRGRRREERREEARLCRALIVMKQSLDWYS